MSFQIWRESWFAIVTVKTQRETSSFSAANSEDTFTASIIQKGEAVMYVYVCHNVSISMDITYNIYMCVFM